MSDVALSSGTATVLITTGGTVLVALIGAVVEFMRRQKNALNEVRENAAETRGQVANDHGTNLRDDLDRLHDDVRAVLESLRRQGHDIREIRSDLRVEREERLAVSERLDNHLHTT